MSLDIGRGLRQLNVESSFVMQSVHDATWLLHNAPRADGVFLSASPFRIPNSLISLRTAVIRDDSKSSSETA